MEKEIYERTDLEIIEFQTGDIILSSSLGEEDEFHEKMP